MGGVSAELAKVSSVDSQLLGLRPTLFRSFLIMQIHKKREYFISLEGQSV